MKSINKPAVLLSSLALAAASFAMSLPVRAGVSVYIVAPGDTLWSIANENLKSPNDWKKLMKFNNMTDQSQLKVDQALRIPSELMKDFASEPQVAAKPVSLPPAAIVPAQDEKAPPMVTTAIREGAKAIEDVSAIPASTNTVAATYGRVFRVLGKNQSKLKVNDTLADKARIRTGDKSSANIVLSDGSVVVLLSDTEVLLSQPLTLLQGEIEYKVAADKELALVSTAAGSVSAQKARFRVAAHKAGKLMRVEVEQGLAIVANEKKQRRVTAGISIQLEAGKAMTEPRQGLMRPDIANLSKSSVNGEANLKWAAISDAKAYRAQLVYASDTYLVLFDEHLSEPKINWRNISPGRYNIRLRSIDDKGLEGLNAELPFVVHGALNPPRSNSPVNGATLPTNKPWIAWSRVPEANSYTLQVARDAEFKTELQEFSYQNNNYYKYSDALPAGEYYWRVLSVSAKRVKSAFGDVRMFKIK